MTISAAACSGKNNGANGKDNNSSVECTSNADCNGGICDLSTNTCQGGPNNNDGTNNDNSNAGTNAATNSATNNGGAVCGDGVVEGNETCDGDCPTTCDDGDACTVGTLNGLAENCTAECTFNDVTACTNGDGCCPDGCTPENDDDCSAECGNGVLDPGENCDSAITDGSEGQCPVGAADCNDNDACTLDAQTGDVAMCTAMCVNEPIVTCTDNDGCCPGACDVTNDNDCQPKVGQACTADGDCPATAAGDGFCMTEEDWRWPGGFCSGGCSIDADCDAGAHCTGRVCMPDCTMNDDCRQGYQCYDYFGTGNTTCAPAPATGEISGGACADDSDCLGALFGADCLDDPELPAGYCISGCQVDEDCAAGTHCASLSNGGQACLPDCAGNMDCRQGYECYDWFGDFSNTCGPVANGGGEIGDACTLLQDCMGGQDGACISTPDWFEGYCAQTGCNAANPCPTGSHCSYVDPVSGEGFCLEDCADVSECRANYACEDVDGDTTTECAPSGNGPGAIGDTCAGVYDCAGGTDAFCIQESVGWREGYCSASCSSDADCGTDAHCGNIDPATGDGICLSSCVDSTTCRADGYGCFDWDSSAVASLECAPAGTGAGAEGDACEGVWECAGDDGAFCLTDDTGWPDGYCADSGCTADTDCGANAHCGFVNPDNGEGVCIDSCNVDADCRSDYGCYDLEGDGASECLPVGDGNVGEPCGSFVDCAGRENALCASEAGAGYPGGYCLLDCTAGSGATCPVGSTCVALQGASYCFVSCTGNADCRAGYTCQADGSGGMICIP